MNSNEVLDTAIRELKFRLPVQPVNKGGYPEGNRDTCDGQCPSCMSNVRNITPRSKKVNYCQYCGQAIDWK
jgi:hypothetical protein